MNHLIKNKFKKMSTLALAIIILLLQTTDIFASSREWGLGYTKTGEKPRGNDNSEYLKEFDAYYIGDSDEKVIYLTFDAGFENGHTLSILDSLKKNEVPATFFLVASYIRDNPELIKRMLNEGHIIGNHTTTHPDMSKITDLDLFKNELSQVEDIYKSVTGADMKKYYRPPTGRYSEENLKLAKQLGYSTIFWSLAYVDWYEDKQPTKETAFSKLIPRIHPGAILLLHSTSKTNAIIMDDLINEYKQMGYEFKSLDYLTHK